MGNIAYSGKWRFRPFQKKSFLKDQTRLWLHLFQVSKKSANCSFGITISCLFAFSIISPAVLQMLFKKHKRPNCDCSVTDRHNWCYVCQKTCHKIWGIGSRGIQKGWIHSGSFVQSLDFIWLRWRPFLIISSPNIRLKTSQRSVRDMGLKGNRWHWKLWRYGG